MRNRLRLFIPIVIISVFSLISCKDNSAQLLNEKIESISEVKINDLEKYKDSYVGDNSAVGNIITKLPANIYNEGFSLKTSNEPYEIVVNYKANNELGIEDYNNFWSDKKPNELLEKNAVVLLSLIQNVEIIEFNVEDIGEKSYKYNRKELEKKYGEDLKNLLKDEISFGKI